MSVSNVSPSTLFGGTWERISNDAYLKIANGSTAGNLGGTSSQHKIPVTSMPSHSHDFTNGGRPLYWDSSLTSIGGLTSGTTVQYTWAASTKSTGGGQAYYPYYFDVFVWRRTA